MLEILEMIEIAELVGMMRMVSKQKKYWALAPQNRSLYWYNFICVNELRKSRNSM